MPKIRMFTDADNTLWDTDAVFAAAQVGLLEDIAGQAATGSPRGFGEALNHVRDVDQRIAADHPDHLRYPPTMLAFAIARTLAGECPERAARAALQAGAAADASLEAVGRYEQRLRMMPSLRSGVREGLERLQGLGIPVVVVTETSLERCGRLLDRHGLSKCVADVLSVTKNEAAYRAIRERAAGAHMVMVGDQLDRDIEAAKQVGFSTIHFPSGFVPVWNRGSATVADHEIRRYDEIPAILLSTRLAASDAAPRLP